MAKSFLKANIRLDKIRQRNLKPHYIHCTDEEKALVKVIESVRQCERDIGKMDRGNDTNWRRSELGCIILESYLKTHNRYTRISSKLDLTEQQEAELYNSCHCSRFYGGSY